METTVKNFVQEGDRITVAAPYAVLSGAGALVGALFGIAQTDAASGASVPLQTTGVVTHTKIGSQAWTVGLRVYWDDTNKRMTSVSSGNTLVGVATAAVAGGAGDTIGTVRLNGSF
jgi:predicted RecA/RadA family phage recombinase